MSNENIIFLNHKEKQCGVYQYGKRSADILKKSNNYNFIYVEVESAEEYLKAVEQYCPIGIIYNYHPSTMAWLWNDSISKFPNIIHYGLHHEGSEPDHIKFNYYLMIDSTFIDTDKKFSILRPLLESPNIIYSNPEIPTISSFGFGFGNKGFGNIVKTVNDQFDEAIIRLHIPRAFYGDRNGEASAGVFPGCYNELKKDKIKLIITTDFLDDEGILNFLASSTINIFLYNEMIGRGLSSAIDYALSVKTPIAISKTYMFRHITNTTPSICVDDRSLLEIINSGSDILQQYRDKWSHNNFIKKYELIITNTKR